MRHHIIDIETLGGLAADPIVVDLVKQMDLRNYRQCNREQQQEMVSIYEKTFALLADAVKDHTKWAQNLGTIIYHLFRKDDADAWFRMFDADYRRNIKGAFEFEKIRDYIRGDTILDFGSGGGYLALRCSQEGYELLQEFVLLAEKDQLKVLMLHDYIDNALIQGITEMNFPFQFKTMPVWNSVLAANGFSVVKTILVGFRRTKGWTGTCHAVFIADRM